MIEATTPTVIPETTYAGVWITGLTVSATDPNAPVQVTATLRQAREYQETITEEIPEQREVTETTAEDGMITRSERVLRAAQTVTRTVTRVELEPKAPAAVLRLEDLYAAAATDPEIGQIVAALTAKVIGMAKERGLV